MTAPIYSFKRGPKTARKPRSSPEHALQVAVKQFLVMCLPPEIVWTSSLSGAFLGPSQRAKMKAAGLRPGAPDLVFVIPGKGSVWIELKSADGVLSTEQKIWRDAIGENRWALCRSVEEVERALVDKWKVVLRPHAWG